MLRSQWVGSAGISLQLFVNYLPSFLIVFPPAHSSTRINSKILCMQNHFSSFRRTLDHSVNKYLSGLIVVVFVDTAFLTTVMAFFVKPFAVVSFSASLGLK